MSPIVAIMSSKLAPELIFGFGQLASVGAYIGFALSSSFTGFVISAVSQGIGSASIVVGGMAIMVKLAPKRRRGLYISLAYSGVGHAAIIAPVLCGVMYDKLGHTWTYIIPGSFCVTTAITSVIVLTCQKKQYAGFYRRLSNLTTLFDTEDLADDSEELLGLSQIIPILKGIFSLFTSYFAYFGLFLSGFAYGSFQSVIPEYTTNFDGGQTLFTTNLLWAGGAVVYSIVVLIVGYLVDKFGAPKLLISALIACIIFFPLIQYMAISIGGILGAICAIFGSIAITDGCKYPYATEIVDESVESKTIAFTGVSDVLSRRFGDAPLENIEGYRNRAVDESRGAGPARIVGFCLVEVATNGGGALGGIFGKRLYDSNGLSGLGIFIASVFGGYLLLFASLYAARICICSKKGDGSGQGGTVTFVTPEQSVQENEPQRELSALSQPVGDVGNPESERPQINTITSPNEHQRTL